MVIKFRPSKMARCMFSEIPAACIEAILHQSDVQDWASLRQVSTAVSQQITQNIASISLLLTEHTTTDQLQEWFQATRQFHNASRVHVHITGEVSAEVFDTATQLLAQRSNPVTELHILAHEHDSYNTSKHWWDKKHGKAHLPTLQPLQNLLFQLHTLVIEGVAVQDVTSNLKQLAAAAATGGWQLQNLILNADWRFPEYAYGWRYVRPCLWSDFWLGLVELAAAFPNLQELSLKVPPTGCYFLESAEDKELYSACMAGGGDDIVFALPIVGGIDREMYDSDADPQVHAAAAAVAVATAVFHAALQLKQLRMMKVTEAPDIWKPQTQLLIDDAFKRKLGTRKPSLLAIAAATAGTRLAPVTLHSVNPQVHLLNGVVGAAAAVLNTPDHGGDWLLQQHSCLKEMQMELEERDRFL